MVSLQSPPITAAQRKELERHKADLEDAISATEQHANKVIELGKKEAALERKAASLHRRAAANFELAAETELAATLKQIERVHEAKREAESFAGRVKPVIFQVIDKAQELISKICQHSYEELMTLIASALCPFYVEFIAAKYQARSAPAVNDLVTKLLAHRIMQYDGVERFDVVVKETLSKVNALLDGSEIFRFEGCEPPTAKSKSPQQAA